MSNLYVGLLGIRISGSKKLDLDVFMCQSALHNDFGKRHTSKMYEIEEFRDSAIP